MTKSLFFIYKGGHKKNGGTVAEESLDIFSLWCVNDLANEESFHQRKQIGEASAEKVASGRQVKSLIFGLTKLT